jgi:hypothetical protein
MIKELKMMTYTEYICHQNMTIETATVSAPPTEFWDIPISVHTVNCSLNSRIDTETVFNLISIYPYEAPKKTRGRRPKNRPAEPAHVMPPSGMIVSAVYKGNVRGAVIKRKKPSKTTTGTMRNQISLYIMTVDKLVNIMLFVNGKMTITGGKRSEHINVAVSWLCKHLQNVNLFNPCINTNYLKVLTYDIRMVNITYSVPFEIDRSGLNSLLKRMKTTDGRRFIKVTYESEVGSVHATIEEPSNPDKRHTFFVYASGRVTMSGPGRVMMEPMYHIFNKILLMYRGCIEEPLNIKN